MSANVRIQAALKWRTPDNKLVLVEWNEGSERAYVPSHDLTPAGLRALAQAAIEAATQIEGDAHAGEVFSRDAIDFTSSASEDFQPQPVVQPERPIIGVVPSTAIQAQAVSAPVRIPASVAVAQKPGEETEDLGPLIETRRAPRAPQGPLPGAAPRAVNVYPSGGYGS
jgi:hypothetical protein